MNNLAIVYREEGRLLESEQLHGHTLAALKRVLGSEHRFTLNSMGRLTGLYCDQGKLDEAIRLGGETVALCERILGPSHAYTLQAQRFLGASLVRQQKFLEAEPLLRSFLAHGAKVPIRWHLAVVQNGLGYSLMMQRRYEEAEPLLLKAHEALTKLAGSIPPLDRHEIEDAAAHISELYRAWDRPEKIQAWQKIGTKAAASR